MQQMRDSWLTELFQSELPDHQGHLEEERVVSLMRRINTTITPTLITQKLKVTHHQTYPFYPET